MAYTVSPQRSTVFPLDSVVRMLLFQDCEEATDVLSCHGLTASDGYEPSGGRPSLLSSLVIRGAARRRQLCAEPCRGRVSRAVSRVQGKE